MIWYCVSRLVRRHEPDEKRPRRRRLLYTSTAGDKNTMREVSYHAIIRSLVSL